VGGLVDRVASALRPRATLHLMRWRILAVLLLAPCLAAALAFGAARGVSDEPVAARAGATSVLWGERVFTTRAGLRTWLVARGARYDRWAKRHRIAARRLQ
jgi:hypothetical protein